MRPGRLSGASGADADHPHGRLAGVYGRFVATLLESVPLSRITLGSICSYPQAQRLMELKLGKENAVSSLLDRGPAKSDDGRLRFSRSAREEVYRYLIECIRRSDPIWRSACAWKMNRCLRRSTCRRASDAATACFDECWRCLMEIRPISIDELKPWSKNPRINDGAVDAVANSIQTFGFNVPILYDQYMMIVAGHVRWKAAKKLGLKTVPGIQLSLSRAQREAFAVADNKTADIASWDYDVLGEILKELPEEGIDLSSLGFSEVELDAILKPKEDFNWDQFQEDLDEFHQNATHVFLPVKVPIDMKQAVSEAIRQRAKEQAIAEKDKSRLAGLVVMSLLGVSPCKSH